MVRINSGRPRPGTRRLERFPHPLEALTPTFKQCPSLDSPRHKELMFQFRCNFWTLPGYLLRTSTIPRPSRDLPARVGNSGKCPGAFMAATVGPAIKSSSPELVAPRWHTVVFVALFPALALGGAF